MARVTPGVMFVAPERDRDEGGAWDLFPSQSAGFHLVAVVKPTYKLKLPRGVKFKQINGTKVFAGTFVLDVCFLDYQGDGKWTPNEDYSEHQVTMDQLSWRIPPDTLGNFIAVRRKRVRLAGGGYGDAEIVDLKISKDGEKFIIWHANLCHFGSCV